MMAVAIKKNGEVELELPIDEIMPSLSISRRTGIQTNTDGHLFNSRTAITAKPTNKYHECKRQGKVLYSKVLIPKQELSQTQS